MIYIHVPYNIKGLGADYVGFMSKLSPDDWGGFLDHDAMFTTLTWHDLCEKAIQQKPDAGAFCGVVSSLVHRYSYWQCLPKSTRVWTMPQHRYIGQKFEQTFGTSLKDVTHPEARKQLCPMAGTFTLIRKSVFDQISNFMHEKVQRVDFRLHEQLRYLGYKIYLIQGLYIYHWFRNNIKEFEYELPRDLF